MTHSPSCSDLNNRLPNGVDRKKTARLWLGFGLLLVLNLVFLGANICMGSVEIPFYEVIRILFGEHTGEVNAAIVWQIRFPRSLAAAILGGALALVICSRPFSAIP